LEKIVEHVDARFLGAKDEFLSDGRSGRDGAGRGRR